MGESSCPVNAKRTAKQQSIDAGNASGSWQSSGNNDKKQNCEMEFSAPLSPKHALSYLEFGSDLLFVPVPMNSMTVRSAKGNTRQRKAIRAGRRIRACAEEKNIVRERRAGTRFATAHSPQQPQQRAGVTAPAAAKTAPRQPPQPLPTVVAIAAASATAAAAQRWCAQKSQTAGWCARNRQDEQPPPSPPA